MRAYKGAYLDGQLVCLGDGHARENGCGKGGGERIAGPHGVGHFDTRRGLEALGAGGEDVAAVGAAGEHQHVEVVLAEDEPALVLDVEPRIAEHAADGDEFLVVDLENVAAAQGVADDLARVEVLPQVDVEDLETVHRRGVEKLHDGVARGLVALGQ